MRNSAARFQEFARVIGALVIAFAAIGLAPAGAAEIRVFAGGAPQETLEALAPQFEKRTGHRVKFTFAHVSVIQKKLVAGEQAEVILLPVPLMANMEKAIGLRSEGRSVIARIGIGVVVPQGGARPDISTVDAVRRMLLEARAIAVPAPEGLTGSHLMRMMSKLGIADEVRACLNNGAALSLVAPALRRLRELAADAIREQFRGDEQLTYVVAADAGLRPRGFLGFHSSALY